MDAPPVDDDLLAFATQLAHRAGALAADHFFDADNATEHKPDGTEVTAADRAVEELIRAELTRHAPADEIHGEEHGTTPGTSGRRWIIDPIDGTYYFARRMPLFSTMLAFEDEHGPAIGIVHDPIARHTIAAGRGRGCRSNGRLTRVTDRARLLGARTAMGNPGTWSADLMSALHASVFLVPSGYTTGLARGDLDAMVVAGFPMGYEDLAPLPVIVTEAGGRVTDLTGAPVLTGDGTVLATNGVLHDEFLALVRGIRHDRDWRTLAGQ